MKHKTDWVCGRCNTSTETAYGTAPQGWITAGFNPVPLSVSSGSVNWKPIEELCNDCGGYLVDFCHGKEQEAIARDNEVRDMLARIELEELQ